MKRLSLTIFVAVLGSLLVFAVAVSAAWWWNVQARDNAFERRLAGELAAEILPAVAAGPEQLRRVLERWNRRAGIDLTVLDEDRNVVAWAGRRLVQKRSDGMPGRHPMQGEAQRDSRRDGPMRHAGTPAFDIELPDGRRLLARPNRPRPFGPQPVSLSLALGLLMLAGAVVAWPVSRRITHRLERLQRGVDQQGAGNLAARVAVEGRDEVAALARSFNQSAERIESLVRRQEDLLASQKRLLANASHELRSPLARIRMAIELLVAPPPNPESAIDDPHGHDRPDPGPMAEELGRNVAELDQLIDEILLASRLETTAPAHDEVDMAGLAAEEANRAGAELDVIDAQAMLTTGDNRLLRRMLRNLLDNARRYGDANVEPVRILLSRDAAMIRLEVLDRGPGVPVGARQRIFDAFYRIEGYSEQSGGVGLGLALVKQIAEVHGGTAVYEPRDGGGSRFVVELPAVVG